MGQDDARQEDWSGRGGGAGQEDGVPREDRAPQEDRALTLDGARGGGSGPMPPFDGYDLLDVPLGDLLRGERATLGKSLLDVERELRIRAPYIAAIENGDIGAFQSQGFIAGYVRSYAKYLGIDAEWTFRRFCDETGFRGIHGRAGGQAAEVKRVLAEAPRRLEPNEVMSSTRISYAPVRDSLLSRVEPGALGSFAVLLVLALGIGYGAWAILHDIQRLQIAPIDEAPEIPLAQLDPLSGATGGAFDAATGFDIALPGPEGVDLVYRPQALEAPLLTPRDQALATLDPDAVGALGPGDDGNAGVAPSGRQAAAPAPVQVTEAGDRVLIFATRPTWVRVTSATGATLYEATLNAGDSYEIPEAEDAPQLRAGNAGSLYFAVNGVALGPAGAGASVVREVVLTADALTATYPMADTQADPDLPEIASLVLDASALPAAPVIVPAQPAITSVYPPVDAPSDLTPEALAALAASNALPVVVLSPGPDDLRPLPRP